MSITRINLNYIILILLSGYAFGVNWFSANIGVMPIDTFAFLDTAIGITEGKLPIRDFWIFTGIVVDYLQALFFLVFGKSWSSYVLHGCFINILASLSFYIFLIRLNLSKPYSFFYSLSFATLCYPVSGTPFAYLHAYVFSLISIFLLCIAIKEKIKSPWFFLPIACSLAFFSMQTPTLYVVLIILFFSFYFLIFKKNYKYLKNFIYGSLVSLLLFFSFLYISDTPFDYFLYQYLLFPLTIGAGRLASESSSYVPLSYQLNFDKIIADFKFIHFFLIPIIILTINNFFRKYSDKNNLGAINLIFIFSSVVFIFNQLITANQIYIFSLIPILASLLHLNLNKFKISYYFIILIFSIMIFSTTKYHFRYNVERKFQDIENLDKSKAIKAEKIHPKMKHLRWITPYSEPDDEIMLMKQAIKKIADDKREKTLITHYQFFGMVLNEDLNILNRWYLWDNNTHPTETHKYFNFYKKMINKNIEENNVKVIYLLGNVKRDIVFDKIENYFTDKCFKSTTIFEERFSYHEIVDCKNK